MIERKLVNVILILSLFSISCENTMIPTPDVVLLDGNVYTVDKEMSTAEAIAIKGDKIIAVGKTADIKQAIGPQTQIINLQGKTVVPGFIDSHYHFIGVGKRAYHLNLDGTKSLREFLEKVKAEVAAKKPGEWVIGRGWIEEDWPAKKFPTRSDLDSVAPDNPVMLTRADGHAIVVNSLALQIAGISESTPNPPGGEIIRDASGVATGMVLDNAMLMIKQHTPSDTTALMISEYAKKAQQTAFHYGLTQIHDMGTDWSTIDVYKSLYEKNALNIRIYAYIKGPGGDAEQLLKNGSQIGLYDDRLSIRGIKIVQDGALGSRGAALLEPYSDANTSGLLLNTNKQIYPTILSALQNNIQMAIHAIGDKANRDVLDLYEKALREYPAKTSLRFRIEHAQVVHLSDVPRFKELDVIPSMQPSHAIGDLHFAIRRLGMDRMAEAYAWRKFLDQGNYIPAGSDAPVEEGNPMIEFYAAVVRKDTTGFSAEGWFPEYRMTRQEALKALTIWGAQAAFMENKIGSVEPGKYADIVVLEKDLMTEPEQRLFAIKVLMTMVGGEVVYKDNKFELN